MLLHVSPCLCCSSPRAKRLQGCPIAPSLNGRSTSLGAPSFPSQREEEEPARYHACWGVRSASSPRRPPPSLLPSLLSSHSSHPSFIESIKPFCSLVPAYPVSSFLHFVSRSTRNIRFFMPSLGCSSYSWPSK